MYRHINKGAWTFSIQDHGWQVFVMQQMKTEAGFHKLSLLAIQNSLQLQENKPNVHFWLSKMERGVSPQE